MAANTLNLPSNWTTFCRLKRTLTTSRNIKALNRFGYRYRLAKGLTGLKADGVGRSLLTYAAMTKLFLAYTTYESIIPTAKNLRIRGVEHYSKNVIFNKDLANSIRKNDRLKHFLLTYNFRDDVKAKLKLLFDASTDDIVCIAFAVRNVFAHGELTTTDIGTGRACDRKLLTNIADEILKYCDNIFTECVKKI
jgi:hypothetical protein